MMMKMMLIDDHNDDAVESHDNAELSGAQPIVRRCDRQHVEYLLKTDGDQECGYEKLDHRTELHHIQYRLFPAAIDNRQ